jgi:hypothetical protein
MAPRRVTSKAADTADKNAPVPQKRVIGVPFAPGNCANPKGRPKGSRNKLDEVFIAALYEAFEEGGAQAVKVVMNADPVAFLNVVAKILPKHVHQQVQVTVSEMSDDELANIAAGSRARVIEAETVQAQLN